jgi:3',5'-cyclic-AMP phosphodiesterase
VLDAGDVLSLLRQCEVDLVLSGHRHVPYVWPIAGMLLVHSGTVSTLRTRGFPNPAYNLIRVEAGRISVDLCVPRGEQQSLGDYPRLAARTLRPPRRPIRARPTWSLAGGG